MIYKIDVSFYDCQETYFADSFQSAYEMFKRLGTKLIRTNTLIKSKMYERKDGEVRSGLYYVFKNVEANTPRITMSPYREDVHVNTSSPDEALIALHWRIYNREIFECIPGVNDLKFNYGK